MLADTGDDDACSLFMCFLHHDVGHYTGVRFVEMGDGFVGKQEVEGLHEGTNHSDTLLLAEAHKANWRLHLVSNAKCLEPAFYLLSRLETGQTVLYLDVLHCREFGKEPQLLEEHTDTVLAKCRPIGCRQCPTVFPVEEDAAVVVFPIADDEAAERALACAAAGFDEVSLPLLEGDLPAPNVALDVCPLQEDLRQRVIEMNVIH